MNTRTGTALLLFPKSPANTETPARGALAKIIVFRRRRKTRKNTSIPVPSRLQ
jgi:hypothetical protein